MTRRTVLSKSQRKLKNKFNPEKNDQKQLDLIVWVRHGVCVWVCVFVKECWQLITLMHRSLRELASFGGPPTPALFLPPLSFQQVLTSVALYRTFTYLFSRKPTLPPPPCTRTNTHTATTCRHVTPAAYDTRGLHVLCSLLDTLEQCVFDEEE